MKIRVTGSGFILFSAQQVKIFAAWNRRTQEHQFKITDKASN